MYRRRLDTLSIEPRQGAVVNCITTPLARLSLKTPFCCCKRIAVRRRKINFTPPSLHQLCPLRLSSKTNRVGDVTVNAIVSRTFWKVSQRPKYFARQVEVRR